MRCDAQASDEWRFDVELLDNEAVRVNCIIADGTNFPVSIIFDSNAIKHKTEINNFLKSNETFCAHELVAAVDDNADVADFAYIFRVQDGFGVVEVVPRNAKSDYF